jgi:hypothetical protein
LAASHPSGLVSLEAVTACRDYAAATSRALLRSRAPLVWERYFASPDLCGARFVALPPPVAAAIAEAVGKGGATHTTFDPAVDVLTAQLQALYEGPYRASLQYAQWAADNLGWEVPPISEGRAAILESAGLSVAEVLRPAGLPGGAGGEGGGAGAAGGVGSGRPSPAAAAAGAGTAGGAGAASPPTPTGGGT